ncbi:MAG: hypothetical protein KA712_02390 [Myxococcales bacterium]|nr:hypothetical protein [Myxococcales bacterium]
MAKQTKTVRKGPQRAQPARTTLALGDLVSEAFEQAFEITHDSRQAAALASLVVQRLLCREGQGRYIDELASLEAA